MLIQYCAKEPNLNLFNFRSKQSFFLWEIRRKKMWKNRSFQNWRSRTQISTLLNESGVTCIVRIRTCNQLLRLNFVGVEKYPCRFLWSIESKYPFKRTEAVIKAGVDTTITDRGGIIFGSWGSFVMFFKYRFFVFFFFFRDVEKWVTCT